MREVYTDGACRGNPGPGGWAWAVPHGPQAAGPDPATTNQRMEVRAALEAVRALDGPLVVVSDSTYVVNCFRNRWWKGWHARGWLNSAEATGRQPRPLGAARGAGAGAGRRLVPLGQGALRRPDERPRRRAGGSRQPRADRGGADSAADDLVGR